MQCPSGKYWKTGGTLTSGSCRLIRRKTSHTKANIATCEAEGKGYRRGYRRKDGTRVKGHCSKSIAPGHASKRRRSKSKSRRKKSRSRSRSKSRSKSRKKSRSKSRRKSRSRSRSRSRRMSKKKRSCKRQGLGYRKSYTRRDGTRVKAHCVR